MGQPGPVTGGSFEDLDFADLLATVGVGDPSALPGVQDKASGRLLSIPLAHEGRTHLLKLDVPEYSRLVENEAYFLSLARRLRQPVVEAAVVRDRHGCPGLLVTRFDRIPLPDSTVERLAVEDAAQLLNVYPADKYAVSLEQVAQRVAQVCAAGPVALRAVFSQVVFAWLTGNGDLHAKNLSVLRQGGEWRMAPTYDLPATVPYGDHSLALPLLGRRDGLSRRRLAEFGLTIGLPPRAVDRGLDEVLAVTAGVVDDLERGAIPFDATCRRAFIRSLRARRRLVEKVG